MSGILALDLGGTKLAAGLFTPGGAIRERATFPLDGRQGAEVGALLLSAVEQLRQHGPISSVGVRGTRHLSLRHAHRMGAQHSRLG